LQLVQSSLRCLPGCIHRSALVWLIAEYSIRQEGMLLSWAVRWELQGFVPKVDEGKLVATGGRARDCWRSCLDGWWELSVPDPLSVKLVK
jgi:hypothetical protein